LIDLLKSKRGMYRHCLFCSRDLGNNEVIEPFPIGRRLAFDASKGRLWVVCQKCERWNLTPLDERWEAIEECERAFRATRVRMSTDNVGLAKLKEGLTLVRVGEPLRPEFAAWRYGDQFGRRRRRTIIWTGAGVAALGALAAGAIAAGVGAAFLGNIPNLIINVPVRARIKTRDGRVIKLRNQHLQKARLEPGSGESEWRVRVEHTKGKDTFEGEEAVRAVGLILPKLNMMAGTKQAIQDAVDRIETAGDPETYLARLPSAVQRLHGGDAPKKQGLVHRLPKPTKLAIEMAVHEEQERRALAGELVTLEAAWRQAEEIAGIADDLLTPREFDDFIARHREGGDPSDPSPRSRQETE
jgi:hypothetical protein